ncbi:MAG: hypothetical protein JEY94_10065 [Melioribacteraceae bacterium]|nr:hypothetical protein [Melioribacteraceae bacterium]
MTFLNIIPYFTSMKKLDFNPLKSGEDFRSNYKLHDLAEASGKNLLTQWGLNYKEFGEDRRYQSVWEKGEDKPDIILSYKDIHAFLDWKGKHHSHWLVNQRAINAYENWSKRFNIPIIIAFFVFDINKALLERRFAFLNLHNYIASQKKQWDKNTTVEFRADIPEFTKGNLLKCLLEYK